jgi:MFS family permease
MTPKLVQPRNQQLGGYAYFHQDGLLDFSFGLWVLLVGISLLVGAPEVGAILALLLIPFWEAAKRTFTTTRLAEPPIEPAQVLGATRTRQLLAGIVVALLLLGLLVYGAATRNVLPNWVPYLFSNYFVALLGVGLTAVLLAIAIFNSLYTFYNHALLTFAAFLFGQAFGIPIPYILILLGSVVGFGGFITLLQFLHTHPADLRLS